MAKERKTEKRGLRRRMLPLCALLFAAALLLALDARHVRFYLSGPRDLELPVGSEYAEPGCRAVSAGSLFGELGPDLPVTAEGAVDGQTLVVYTRTYTARWLLWEGRAERRVYVVDRTPPVITLTHREGYAPSWLDGYEEEGFRAADNIDGEVTAQVERVYLGDRVEYSVSDAAGNRTTVTRQIPYSVGRPRIRPVGGERLRLPASFSFTDPGYEAIDESGNDLTSPPVTTLPYPGFPTDMQSMFMAALSISQGCSILEETIFENRFRVVDELKKMGADIHVIGRRAMVCGVKKLQGAVVEAKELRGGAALLLAGLSADGDTYIKNDVFIRRGYENIVRDLKLLGAKIEEE